MIIIFVKGHTFLSHLGRRLLCVLTVDVFLTRSDSQNCYFLGAVTLWRWWKWKDGDFDKRLMMYWLLNLSWCFPHGVEIKSAGGDDYQYTTIYNIQYTIYNIHQYTTTAHSLARSWRSDASLIRFLPLDQFPAKSLSNWFVCSTISWNTERVQWAGLVSYPRIKG